MTWDYAYTPAIWPSLLTVLLLSALSAYSWRRRSVPGALPFAVGSLFGAIWAAGSLMEIAAVDPSTKFFWVRFQAVWQLPAVTAITCFVLDYTWPGRWLTRRNIILLSLAPLLYMALVLTNGLHHLVWFGFTVDGVVVPLRGPINWLFIAYGYGLGVVNILLFSWLFWRSPPHRLPVGIMLVGQIGSRVVYLLEMMRVIHVHVPLDVFILAYVDLIYAVALFGFRIFDPVQLARHMVIDQMREGMLVLDPQGRVTSLNPAAKAILQAPAGRILGRPFQELVPEYSQTNGDQRAVEPIEINQEMESETRCYSLVSSILKDWRGLEVGRMLLLHDITAQKLAHARLVGQQRTRAAHQERERLARELHDSLGQTLAATHLQASTARLLLARGDTVQTERYLEEMAAMTMAAEADVREYLLGAKTTCSADLPFFPALCLYLERFGQQYGLQIGLDIPQQIEAQGLSPAIEVQLMRIIQEALSNVRKHAGAERVHIEFARAGPLLQITIRDDGRGFDPGAVARQSDRYGLQAMGERAEELGGHCQVISQPGQGAQVIVQVPLGREQASDA